MIIRYWLAYKIAELYQSCWWLVGRCDVIMDFLNWLERLISPLNALPNEIDGIMVEVIRKRAGIPKEKWENDLAQIQRQNELESLGLPKDK